MVPKDALQELRGIAATLAATATEGGGRSIAGPLQSLMDVCNRFTIASSGSWIGYHSRIYYKDFVPPPPGALFSPEWGTQMVSGNPLRGQWMEYTQADVVNAIEAAAGTPDLSAAQEFSKRAKEGFRQGKAAVVSLLTIALDEREDSLIRETLIEVRSLHPLTQDEVVQSKMPKGDLSSRDSTAIHHGLIAPAHIVYLAGLVAIRDPGMRCSRLGDIALEVAEHLERVGSDVQGRDPAGSRVFIGHGGSHSWRALKDFLSERLGLEYEEFNRVSPVGVATTARLQSMLDGAIAAFMVLTAEDEHADGSEHARENVIHEVGLFQGRLGFEHAYVVLEDGCEQFSNIHGLGQIRFPRGNIEACFDEVRRVLERENIIH